MLLITKAVVTAIIVVLVSIISKKVPSLVEYLPRFRSHPSLFSFGCMLKTKMLGPLLISLK